LRIALHGLLSVWGAELTSERGRKDGQSQTTTGVAARALFIEQLGDRRTTTTAARTGAAHLSDVLFRACPLTDGAADGAFGDLPTVTHEHDCNLVPGI
jgi:hypothetical protein